MPPIVRSSTDSTDTTPPNPPEGEGDWEAFKNDYPRRTGEQGWASAKRLWLELLAVGVSASDLVAAVKRYAALMTAEGKIGTRFVMKASTWLDPAERRWFEAYHITESMEAKDDNGIPASIKGGPPNWILSDREISAKEDATPSPPT